MAACVTNNEEYRYFLHKGVYYGNGTKVIFTDNFVQNYTYNGKKIWKYAWFSHRIVVNGRSMYFFNRDKTDWSFLRQNNISQQEPQTCCPFFVIDATLIDLAIEKITYPIIVAASPKEKKSDWDDAQVIKMWFVYIGVLVASLVFKEFYLVWIIASILFFYWRKEKLNR